MDLSEGGSRDQRGRSQLPKRGAVGLSHFRSETLPSQPLVPLLARNAGQFRLEFLKPSETEGKKGPNS